MKVFGIQFVFSTTENGLWFDSDEHYTNTTTGLSAILKEACIKQTLIWNENRPEGGN